MRDLPASTLGIDVENGYTPKYITIKGKQKLVKELKAEAKKCDGVLLATDPDQMCIRDRDRQGSKFLCLRQFIHRNID